jgi:hypothetical protein
MKNNFLRLFAAAAISFAVSAEAQETKQGSCVTRQYCWAPSPECRPVWDMCIDSDPGTGQYPRPPQYYPCNFRNECIYFQPECYQYQECY